MTDLPERVDLPVVETVSASLSEDGWWWDGGQVDALVITLAPEPEAGEGVQPRPGAAQVAARYRLNLAELARREKHEGAAGQVATITLPPAAGDHRFGWESLPNKLVLLGTGVADADAMRRAGAALGKAVAGLGSVAVTAGHSASGDELTALVEGFLLASYRGPWLGQHDRTGPAPAERLVLLGVERDALAASAARARSGAGATCDARWLAAVPSSTKSPRWLAERAVAAAAGVTGLSVTVHDEEWLRREGFGALLAVGGGSATPPRLVVLEHNPPGAGDDVVALVGKGITFDTGGLSIKPREAMIGMKTDMAGAAAVLAAAVAAARAKISQRFVAVLPLAENAVSGSSYRPGDVVTTWDGTTVEVTNTDAEGRMVLADALAWVTATYEPSAVIDVATLTGAITLGLGRGHAGLYATADGLAESLGAAGEASGEPLWRMPLVAEYRASLESSVADLCHQSTDPHISGGSITAALFLEHFARGTPWAHLDIAGAGRSLKARADGPEGPTGFGARLLLDWLTTRAATASTSARE